MPSSLHCQKDTIGSVPSPFAIQLTYGAVGSKQKYVQD